MASRGRPRKDALSCAAAEAKNQGQSYGYFMEAQQKKRGPCRADGWHQKRKSWRPSENTYSGQS